MAQLQDVAQQLAKTRDTTVRASANTRQRLEAFARTLTTAARQQQQNTRRIEERLAKLEARVTAVEKATLQNTPRIAQDGFNHQQEQTVARFRATLQKQEKAS